MSGLFAEPTGPRSDAPWDLSFLRVGVLVALAVTAVAVPVTGLLAGWSDALGILVGAVIVTAFFCVSGLVIAWAGKIDDTWTLPAALGTFGIKALVLYAVLSALPADGWLDRRALAWSVIAGALLWSGVQLRWVWTRQIYYTSPPPPPVARTANSQPGAADDPGIRPARG
ncbi:hypothetical protein SAMN05661080_00686 [Modestobacter sp. DSM 44400]|uniref:hypothetical protein n=1 Tax=Modestobacter sp. DSM 44400 TaxID=1550230 RepID=UPI00089B5BF9|nr:hypothetical protein [Modestobacter sp. DSM 44400]SDX65265.1 hypothetical protein SAMN05661080_00686 [Modestobacter sp. DSM 44400]